MRATIYAAAIVLAYFQPTVATASGRLLPSASPLFARVYSTAQPPYGFVQFCRAHPQECSSEPSEASRVEASPDRLAELHDVNRAVNRAIKPITDKDQFGVDELWTLPTSGKGDCEEYVLLKRKLLREQRWPTSALLITVVRDEDNQGHAVLTVRMNSGDFILDNKHDDIRLWSEVPYTYIMRQSYLNPMAWMSLAPNNLPTPVGVAKVRPDN